MNEKTETLNGGRKETGDMGQKQPEPRQPVLVIGLGGTGPRVKLPPAEEPRFNFIVDGREDARRTDEFPQLPKGNL